MELAPRAASSGAPQPSPAPPLDSRPPTTPATTSSSGAPPAGAVDTVAAGVLALLPGAAHGATAVLLGHPLDTAKVRMQTAGPHACRGLVGTVFSMAAAEGGRSLYRGVAPPLLMAGAKRSLQFAFWDFSRSCSTEAEAQGPANSWRTAIAALGRQPFLAGAVAGGMGTVVGCPMHVVKIQTQFGTAQTTRNAWTCTKEIYGREGMRGFYRGLPAHLVKDVCFAGTYLGLYTVFRDAVRTSDSTSSRTSADAPPHLRVFAAGAMASTLTWLLLFPLDTIKTLVQARQPSRVAVVLRRPSELYRGIIPSLLRAGPVSGVAMIAYEQTWAFVK